MKIKIEAPPFCVACESQPDTLYELVFGNDSVSHVKLCRDCLILLQAKIKAKLRSEAVVNKYFTTLIAEACDADKRQENTLPAEMITVGYAETLMANGMLEEGDD